MDSTLTWTPLLCGNRKRPTSDHLLIEERKYVQKNLLIELQSTKKFGSWNGYPKNTVNAILEHVMSKETLTNDVISNEEKDKIPTNFISID